MSSKNSACTEQATSASRDLPQNTPPSETASVQCIARALGDEHRLVILRMIHEQGKLSCGALVKQMPLAQATVSHHLKELTQAGLLHCEAEGAYNMYSLRPEILVAFTDQLHQMFNQQECAK